MLVPGPEPARPAAWHVHSPDHGVLTADVTHQVDRAVHEHPPVVGMLALAEQHNAGLDANLRSARHQLRQLIVRQTVKDGK